MNQNEIYELDDLARKFGLKPRMARYWIQNILPEHHKTGRGTRAIYGQDTYNCFEFIKKVKQKHKFSNKQIGLILASLTQEEIDRVASGEEDVEVRTISRYPRQSSFAPEMAMARSIRAEPRGWLDEEGDMSSLVEEVDDDKIFADAGRDSLMSFETPLASLRASQDDQWHTIYDDGDVRIQSASDLQLTDKLREQVKSIGRLLRSLFS